MRDDKKIIRLLYFIGIIPIVWLALLIAPYTENGLMSIIKNSNYIFNNPFVYLKTDNDVQKLVTNLFKSTTLKGSTTNAPFWDTADFDKILSVMRSREVSVSIILQNLAQLKALFEKNGNQ